MGKIDTATRCIERVRAITNECMVFCSLGKDSMVVLDLVAPKFDKVVCIFMYFVKDLEHINKYIRYFEARYSNVSFIQVPHWTLSYVKRSGLFCVPNPKQKLLKLRDIVDAQKINTGIEYCFLGMKKADSMNRRLMMMQYEKNDYINQGLAYPLADWTQKDVLAYMRMHKLPSPVRYSIYTPSGGVGFNSDCLVWMRENYPDDLRKFLDAFPFAEHILFQYDERKKNEKELAF